MSPSLPTSVQWAFVSLRGKRGRFQCSSLKKLKYKIRQTQTEFLFVPKVGTNLLCQDLMTKLGISSVRLLSHVWLFVTPWTTAHQASLSITNSRSLLKLRSIESVMPSSHLILCHPLFTSCLHSFPAARSFPMSQYFKSGDQSLGVSASASVLPMNIQGWSPLGLTGLISLQSKGLSRVFSNTTVQKHQFFGAQLSLKSNPYIHTWPLGKP